MKTNREKNQQHERDQLMRVRPKEQRFEFAELEKIVNTWIRTRLEKHE